MGGKFLIYFSVFKKIAASCHKTDEYCLSCEEEKCKACYESYLNTTTHHCEKPKINIPNCMAYTSEKSCLACGIGFYLSDEVCRPISKQNCAVADSLQLCRACLTRFAPTQGECDVKGTLCPANCLYCTRRYDQPSCILCDRNWAIIHDKNGVGSCISTLQSIQNCMIVSHQRCLICLYGFYMINGICVQSSLSAFHLFADIFWLAWYLYIII